VETVAKRPRRLFSAADKLRLVKEADACLASGERGSLEALLRREGMLALRPTWQPRRPLLGRVVPELGQADIRETYLRSIEPTAMTYGS
jgi:hypothetical protein